MRLLQSVEAVWGVPINNRGDTEMKKILGADILREVSKELYNDFAGDKEKYVESIDNEIELADSINLKYGTDSFEPVAINKLIAKREIVSILHQLKID